MRFISSILFFCAVLTSTAQNLVPNPSFEDTIACPSGNWNKVIEWKSYRDSPDYFNSCSSYRSVPQTGFGFQYAATGNAFAGFFSHANGVVLQNYREFIGSSLLQPLIIGQKYFISVKFNKSNNPTAQCATNKMGILFSTISFNDSMVAPIRNFAHLYTTTIISDTVNWTSLNGSIIADSAYSFIIIGNFFDDNNTDSVLLNSSACNAYYFVDDVCVSTDSLLCYTSNGIYEIVLKNPITIYPNPFSLYTTIRISTEYKSSNFELKIYDLLGGIVKNITLTKCNNNELRLERGNLTEGIYLLKIQISNKIFTQKILIKN